MTDQETALRILAALRKGPIGDAGVLVGSSGLFGFETQVPVLTEDIDIAVPEKAVTRQGRAIVEALQAEGFEHQPGTASFLAVEVRDLLAAVEPERLADVRAAAQAAVLALKRDPTFDDAGAVGYAPMRQQVEVGLERLTALLEHLDA